MDDDAIASVARALGHPARVAIVRLLAAQRECRGADVFSSMPLAQSTISEHLRVLREADIVRATPDGAHTVYCLAAGPLAALAAELRGFAEASAACARKER